MPKSMAKGAAYLTVATIVFMLTGYAVHFGLARLLGPAMYGIYGVVLSLISITNIILTAGIYQAVSKYISAGENAEIVKRTGLKIQAVFALLIFCIYELLAGVFAALLGDSGLVLYIRVSGFILIGYAFYSVFIGYFNGMREFKKQAGLQILYSLSKMFFIFAFVLLGFSLYGAFIGFALAPLLGFFVALLLSKGFGKGDKFDWKKLVAFAWPIVIFSVASSLLISVDLFSVKAILGRNIETGFYNAATTIARVPYSILAAVGLVLFPSISHSLSKKDMKLTKRYISETVRYLALLLIPSTFLIMGTSTALVNMLYSSRYLSAGGPLSILVVGFAFLTIFGILANVIMASGRPKVPMAMSIILVVASLILNTIFIPVYELKGAAVATTMAAFMGMLMASFYVTKRFGPFVKILSIARIGFASLVIYFMSLFIQLPNKWWLPLEYAVLFAVYFGLLILAKEWKKDDFARLAGMMPKRIRVMFTDLFGV